MRLSAYALMLAVAVLAAAACPTDCRAQAKVPHVGLLLLSEAALRQTANRSFVQRLTERGWVPGKNVVLEYRFARGEGMRFNDAAEELVRLKVDVIFALSAPAAVAAYAATRTIPIVIQDYTNDPVSVGYAESYSRPGKNLTGVFLDAPGFAGKWIELLRVIVPGLQRVAVLWDPAPGATHLTAVQRAAQPLGLQLEVHEVRVPDDLDKAFSAFRGRPRALIILPSPMTWVHSARLADLALKHRLPATSMAREFAEAPATHAAYAATTSIPIVAQDLTNDPVAAGYAQSYGHPGKNLTGVFLDAPEFAGKWIELLRAIVSGLQRVAVLWDPAPGSAHLKAVQAAAQRFGVQVQTHEVRTPDDLDKAFAAFRGGPQALIILPSPMTFTHSARLAGLALKYRLPGTSIARGFAEAGGAISYGPDIAETSQRNGFQVAKVLGGAKPGDLPIERPTKFDLVLNMKTIKALGLKVPDSLLLGAEQVGR